MNYPYYIVTWSEGRIPCPPQYRGTVIQKEFDKGRIGGKRTFEQKVQHAYEAYAMACRDRFNRTVYEVTNRNSCRMRIRIEDLKIKMREQAGL